MAKTVQKELSFAERLTNALNAVEEAQKKVADAQAEYEQAKKSLADELNDLPGDHPLRLLTTSGNGSHKSAVGKRARATKNDLESLKANILDQMASKGKMAKKDFDFQGYKEQTFMGQVRELVEKGTIKKEGEKASTRYWVK